MKLNPIVSAVRPARIVAAVTQQTRREAEDLRTPTKAPTTKPAPRPAPAPAAFGPKALVKFASICALGMQVPAAIAAPLRGAAQTPLAPNENFKLLPEQGGWDCEAFVDGKVVLRGVWQQFPEDRWGIDIVQKMYVPADKHDKYGPMEQIVSWDITTQPFKMARWPADRHEVQDIIVKMHQEDAQKFVWNLQVELPDNIKWNEKWVDIVSGNGEAMVRERFSNRTSSDLQLQDTFRCRHW